MYFKISLFFKIKKHKHVVSANMSFTLRVGFQTNF